MNWGVSYATFTRRSAEDPHKQNSSVGTLWLYFWEGANAVNGALWALKVVKKERPKRISLRAHRRTIRWKPNLWSSSQQNDGCFAI